MRTLLALALTTALACSHEPKTAPVTATPDGGHPSPVQDAAPDETASSHDGTTDYRGTLGANTAIAVHLTRNGHSLLGSYVYTSVGRPIPLSGSIDANGVLLLTENANGKTTGSLRLDPSGAGLAGEWSSPGATKVFPVRLTPGAPWAQVTPDASGGRAPQAEACLADPLCLAVDAARWFVDADDAHEIVDCFRFVDGAGTRRDLGRGRACLERSVGARACDPGSSSGLEGAALATMLIDGAGGPQDIPRAKALFAGCFEDETTSWVRERADAKTKDPSSRAETICESGHGTTLVSNDCGVRERVRAQTRAELQGKQVVAGLDEAGKSLFGSAARRYGAYVAAMGEYGYEVYIQGSIRNGVMLARETELYEARARQLKAFPQFVAPATSVEDVRRGDERVAAALAKVTTATAAERVALEKTEETWEAYRDAEVALYAEAFEAKQGAEQVRRAMRASLDAQRAKECGPRASRGG